VRQENELYVVDGMMRVVGAMVKKTILEAHPKSPRLNAGDREEARSWVLETFRGNVSMRHIETLWDLPYPVAANFLRRSNLHDVGIFCRTYHEYRAARHQVEAEGLVVRNATENGQVIVKNPAIHLYEQAWDQLWLALKEVGIRPTPKLTRAMKGTP